MSDGDAPGSRVDLRRGLRIALYSLAVLLVAHGVTSSRSGPSRGAPAPAFSLAELGSGARLSLDSLRGRPAVLEFMASWCTACERAQEGLNQAARARRAAPVQFVGVSLDTSPEVLQATVERWGVPYPVALDDGTLAKRWRVEQLPTLVLLDAEGVVRWVHVGVPGSWSGLERELARLGAPRVD